MHIYFIGINGAGISALAHFALDCGYKVSGSSIDRGVNMAQLEARGADCNVGDNAVVIEQVHQQTPIDWVVISSAIPETSPELQYARQHGLKVTKRDEFINTLLREQKLKLIAVAGTHGKTTTSAMISWALRELGEPVSHIVGTNLSFANSGSYQENSNYLVLEADEYDRMMLAFHPDITLITSLDYDHPDIYPTEENYFEAFRTFIEQSNSTWTWLTDAEKVNPPKSARVFALEEQPLDTEDLPLAGAHNRANALLVGTALGQELELDTNSLLEALESFPGTDRRFEQIGNNTYSDYAHTPTELSATLQLAREQSRPDQKIIAVYQPHQNIRQHLVKEDYKNAFNEADAIYWLPTYFSREDPELEVLTPDQLIEYLADPAIAQPAKLDQELIDTLEKHQANGDMVIFFGAGSIDDWAREHYASA